MGDPHLDGSFRRAIRGGCEQEQFQILEGVVNSTNLVQMEDRWVWNLESSGDFSVASFRRKIDDSRLPMVGDKMWWVKYMPIKINVLVWKVRVNALPTRFNLSRRGITIQSIICSICDCGVESTKHVSVRCCLTRQLGRMVSNWWNITYAEVDSIEEWKDWCSSLRLAVKSKMVFEGVWFTLWWYIWTYRNKLLFDGNVPKKASLFDSIVSSSFLWCSSRCKTSFGWTDWLKNLHLISL